MILPKFGPVIGIFVACALGMPVPEEITLLSAGLLGSAKEIPIILAALFGWAGLCLSDSILFFLGRHLGPGVFRLPLLRNVFTETRVKMAESRIRSNGILVCFVGRFLPSMRMAVFAAAGALSVNPIAFLITDALAGATAVLIWVSIGSWMGSYLGDTAQHLQYVKTAVISLRDAAGLFAIY